jgi:Ribonuclease G/E
MEELNEIEIQEYYASKEINKLVDILTDIIRPYLMATTVFTKLALTSNKERKTKLSELSNLWLEQMKNTINKETNSFYLEKTSIDKDYLK